MSASLVNLDELLLNLSALTEQGTAAEGEKRFHLEFITRNGRSGALTAHDGVEVRFFADRYQHAFHTSQDRSRHAYAKDKVARDRIERIRWIRPIIEGRVAGIECWEVPLKVP